MAYDELLAQRIRERFAGLDNVEEKAMMGGLTFMYHGKMCVGIIKDELMCRIDPDEEEQALKRPGCRMMDFTSRPMRGYIMINETGMGTPAGLDYWMGQAIAFNARAKASKPKKKG